MELIQAVLPAGAQGQAHSGGGRADRRGPDSRGHRRTPGALGHADLRPGAPGSAARLRTGRRRGARAAGRLLTTGTGACPGQASGILALDPDRARELAAAGQPVILARPTTSPADLHGMIAAQGILTATGGTTSHAAVIARALGKPCVVGCGDVVIRPGDRVLEAAAGTSWPKATTYPWTGPRRGLPRRHGSVHRPRGRRRPGHLAWHVPGPPPPRNCSAGSPARDVEAARRPGDRPGHRHRRHAGCDRPPGRPESRRCWSRRRSAQRGCRRWKTPSLRSSPRSWPRQRALEWGSARIDFLADESREVMHQTALITRHPQLSMPLGAPALVEAQIAGLARAAVAASQTGCTSPSGTCPTPGRPPRCGRSATG